MLRDATVQEIYNYLEVNDIGTMKRYISGMDLDVLTFIHYTRVSNIKILKPMSFLTEARVFRRCHINPPTGLPVSNEVYYAYVFEIEAREANNILMNGMGERRFLGYFVNEYKTRKPLPVQDCYEITE